MSRAAKRFSKLSIYHSIYVEYTHNSFLFLSYKFFFAFCEIYYNSLFLKKNLTPSNEISYILHAQLHPHELLGFQSHCSACMTLENIVSFNRWLVFCLVTGSQWHQCNLFNEHRTVLLLSGDKWAGHKPSAYSLCSIKPIWLTGSASIIRCFRKPPKLDLAHYALIISLF
jgi:hypothetical protein